MLICPECQESRDWADDLDTCAECGSDHLVRRLGEVECRECGAVGEQAVMNSGIADDNGACAENLAGGMMPDLADEVEQALRRIFRRSSRATPIG